MLKIRAGFTTTPYEVACLALKGAVKAFRIKDNLILPVFCIRFLGNGVWCEERGGPGQEKKREKEERESRTLWGKAQWQKK